MALIILIASAQRKKTCGLTICSSVDRIVRDFDTDFGYVKVLPTAGSDKG